MGPCLLHSWDLTCNKYIASHCLLSSKKNYLVTTSIRYYRLLIQYDTSFLYRLPVLKIFEKKDNTNVDIYLSSQLNCSNWHATDVQLLWYQHGFIRMKTQNIVFVNTWYTDPVCMHQYYLIENQRTKYISYKIVVYLKHICFYKHNRYEDQNNTFHI